MPDPNPPPAEPLDPDVRSRILVAAAGLVAAGGVDAATTRAVAAAASVQAPTIYRLFGDKDGLLDAVADQVLADYVASKRQSAQSDDPMEDFRQGWDTYVDFGLGHPHLFALMTAPRPGTPSTNWAAGLAVLRERLRRIARTGRLRVSEERAVDLIHSMGTGVILVLLQTPHGEREGLSHAARDAVLAAVLHDQAQPASTGATGAASALRACLDDVALLTPGERQLLNELLQRIAQAF